MGLQGASCVGARQGEQVVDEAAHALGFADQVCQDVAPLGLGEGRLAQQEVEVATHRGEGRTQLVRGVVDEAALGLVRTLQAL